MSAITDLSPDERRARVMLSLLTEPDDPLTGRLVRKTGAVETLRRLDGDGQVPGLNRVDSQVWRDRLSPRTRLDGVAGRLNSIERSRITVLIPGDEHWPGALGDLGDRAPYVLFARGATSFLTRPMSDLVTVTGARASTAYGEHIAAILAGGLAANERVTVAGGAYGIEGAVHRATLAAGGDTIAVLAGGVDRPYPNGHRELLPTPCTRAADARQRLGWGHHKRHGIP
ncbi:DNA-processing protein DprA [Aestuariimicrobium ganziense]|uniref:DNA-processing protein DprA n=1 Tax=Aestuariimicrobium ganziense TaxID=2773677 RepID=UPI001942F6BF|nr:DNA-processing protein DprA [Aestuariimicrobium ganziense]